MSTASSNEAASEGGGAALRALMREVPAPVTVVTARAGAEEEPFGITIGSFASVSLRPPLISFNVSEEARTYGWLAAAERFAVHVLRRGQAALAERFADPGLPPKEQFSGVAWHAGADGRPVLDGVLAVLHCRLHSRIRAGDSDLVVGRVVSVEHDGLDGESPANPLLYYRRAYRTVKSSSETAQSSPEGANRSSRRAPETPAPKSAKS